MQMPVAGLCRACYMRDHRAKQPNARKPAVPTTTPCTYKHAHGKIRRYRGKAKEQECAWPGCDRQANEWSYTPGSQYEQEGLIDTYGRTGNKLQTYVKWSPWPYDYEPLCHAHHLIKDGKSKGAA